MTAYAPHMSALDTIRLAYPDNSMPTAAAESTCEAYGIEWDTEIDVRLDTLDPAQCDWFNCTDPATTEVHWTGRYETGRPPAMSQRAIDNGPDGMVTETDKNQSACADHVAVTTEWVLGIEDRNEGVSVVIAHA